MITYDKEIQKQFDAVVRYSQDFLFEYTDHNPKTDPIFNIWAKNKEKLFRLLGNKLIYETEPLEFHISKEVGERDLSRFCNYGLIDQYGLPLLASFILSQPY
jgi:hypothetical protein